MSNLIWVVLLASVGKGRVLSTKQSKKP